MINNTEDSFAVKETQFASKMKTASVGALENHKHACIFMVKRIVSFCFGARG